MARYNTEVNLYHKDSIFPQETAAKGWITQIVLTCRKIVWLLFEALTATEPLSVNTPITILPKIPVLGWTKMCPEVAGVTLSWRASGTSRVGCDC